MELNKSNIKKILGVVAFAALFYTGLQQWDRVCAFAAKIFGYLFPFLLGGGIAFILNVPMRFLEGRVVEPLLRRGPDRLRRSSRGVSIVLTLALVAGVLFFVVFLVAPALDETAQSVAKEAPDAFRSLRRWVYSLRDKYPEIAKEILSIDIDWKSVGEQVGGWISAAGAQALSSTVGMAASVIGVFVNFFIALTFSLYVLSHKEKLGRQCRMLFYAFLPDLRPVSLRPMYGSLYFGRHVLCGDDDFSIQICADDQRADRRYGADSHLRRHDRPGRGGFSAAD